MVHLVWMKDNGDEAKSVRARLMECYWQIYLAPDEALTEKENIAMVAKNLVRYDLHAQGYTHIRQRYDIPIN